ncbi:MAG: hypothetical protein JW913_19360 [Chitinispirillaceae bacterium]|nr:hypothetical protein [Chitinispirillaceae bacterium]
MPPKVYIFSGNDAVGKEAARSGALRTVGSTAPALLVKETFDPSNEPFGDFLQKVISPTLFGDIRLFSINHAESLADGELDELDRFLAELPDDVYLFIDIGETGRRKGTKTDPAKKLHAADRSKKEADRYVCRDFQKPPDYKVAQWLCENVPEWCGRKIEREAAELLVDLAGYDTAVLFSEIRKIDIHLDERLNVDCAAVETIVGPSRSMTVFELAAACGARQPSRVMQIINSLFTASCSVPMVVGVLYRHYGAMLRIRHYGRQQPQDVKLLTRGGGYEAKNQAAMRIGRAAGLLHQGEERKVYPVVIASGIVAQAQQYTDRQLETVLSWLVEFDVAVKTGRQSGSRREVELFCYRLLRVANLVASGESS